MNVGDPWAGAVIETGSRFERLVPHPRLPLVACLDTHRPAVEVWDGSGPPRRLTTVGADQPSYDGDDGWRRDQRTPDVSWHPEQPDLVVTDERGVRRWSPAGSSPVHGLPPGAAYRWIEFSPDGRTLWGFPSSGDTESDWDFADAIELASGTVHRVLPWDTGIAVHPGGRLVSTLLSDQGATLVGFARVDENATVARLSLVRRGLVLDADGYQKPLFSPDGRYLAIRGNAYENTLDVFSFPALEQVLAVTLGSANPGFPVPAEWREQLQSWSRHNIAFAAVSGALLVGTPRGTVVEIDLHTDPVDHEVLTGTPVTALAVLPGGDLVVAGASGTLTTVPASVVNGGASEAVPGSAAAAASAFLASTSDVAGDAPWEDLDLTDGARTWTSNDGAAVTNAADTDPTWLRLQAAINAHRPM